jgi:hypothetical protein
MSMSVKKFKQGVTLIEPAGKGYNHGYFSSGQHPADTWVFFHFCNDVTGGIMLRAIPASAYIM